jgi:hypothetical protein
MVVVDNLWWRGGAKNVSKNIMKRTAWSSFNLVRTGREHIVYLSLAIGLALIFLGQWISVVSYSQQEKLIKPLRDTDEAIDEVIDGLNFLTQELPNDVLEWVNTTVNTIDVELSNLFYNAQSTISKPVNHIAGAIEDAINDVIKWGKQKAQDNSPTTLVQFPIFRISRPALLWKPIELQLLDLSKARIPDRDFSVEGEMTPFIKKACNIPVIVAYYIIAIGAVLLAYGAARLGYAFITPWIPRLRCCTVTGELCVKCVSNTTKGMKNVALELQKPWIHIPFAIGIILVVVVTVLLIAQVDKTRVEIEKPLKKCDDGILDVVNLINNFTASIPPKVKAFTDNMARQLESDVTAVAEDALNTVKDELTAVFHQITDAINSALSAIGLGNVQIPDRISEIQAPFIDLPKEWLPRIPLIDLSSLYLPRSMAFMSKSFGPVVKKVIDGFSQVVYALLILGIVLTCLPGFILACVFLKPFIPKPIKKFFLKPDYVIEVEMTSTKDPEANPPTTK